MNSFFLNNNKWESALSNTEGVLNSQIVILHENKNY